jgi:hypothetical protein
MSSGNTCTSTASLPPSGPGTVVVPMKEPTLISANAILTMPTTRMSPAIVSLTSSPLRDFTTSVSPSTLSMVPRTREGEVCCASAEIDDVATSAMARSGRK